MILVSDGQQKKEQYSNSDYFQIKDEIQREYRTWLEKGEFEKSKDFQDRIANSSSTAFDSICYKVIVYNFKDRPKVSYTLLKYNADTEKFGIEFNFNNLIFKDSLNIPLKDASIFKDEFENLELHVNPKDWRFIDGNLAPTKITLSNDVKAAFKLSFTNERFKDILFSTQELGFKLLNDLNHQFNYNEFYNRAFALGQTEQIILKNNFQQGTDDNENEDKIFTKVENEAAFPGGESAWRRYLEKNRNTNTPVENGAPEGTYQVIIRFIVSKDGTVSHVTAESMHGYGMEEEAVKIIKKGPKWTPALQNGRNVNSYRRQPITFIVEEKK
jgi:hypothetical protein